MVGISKDSKITGVEIGNHSETPGLGSKATEPMFKNQYVDKDVLNSLLVVKGSTNNDNEISAISLSFVAFSLNALLHNNSIVTGDAFVWLLWGFLMYSYSKCAVTNRITMLR